MFGCFLQWIFNITMFCAVMLAAVFKNAQVTKAAFSASEAAAAASPPSKQQQQS